MGPGCLSCTTAVGSGNESLYRKTGALRSAEPFSPGSTIGCKTWDASHIFGNKGWLRLRSGCQALDDVTERQPGSTRLQVHDQCSAAGTNIMQPSVRFAALHHAGLADVSLTSAGGEGLGAHLIREHGKHADCQARTLQNHLEPGRVRCRGPAMGTGQLILSTSIMSIGITVPGPLSPCLLGGRGIMHRLSGMRRAGVACLCYWTGQLPPFKP